MKGWKALALVKHKLQSYLSLAVIHSYCHPFTAVGHPQHRKGVVHIPNVLALKTEDYCLLFDFIEKEIGCFCALEATSRLLKVPIHEHIEKNLHFIKNSGKRIVKIVKIVN